MRPLHLAFVLCAAGFGLGASPAVAAWQYSVDAFDQSGRIVETFGADATPAANCARRSCTNFRMCGHTLWGDSGIEQANAAASYFALRETSTGNLVC